MTKNAATPQTTGFRKPPIEIEEIIERIQGRKGAYPREDREEDMLKVIGSFRYLIRRIARQTYNFFPHLGITPQEFEHETLTKFCEMMIDDYVSPKYGGLTTFAPYVQRTLAMRMLYFAQKVTRDQKRFKCVDYQLADSYDAEDMVRNVRYETGVNAGGSGSLGVYTSEIREAMLIAAVDIEEHVLENISSIDVERRLAEIEQVAEEVLDARELYIFKSLIFQGKVVSEILSNVKAKDDDRTVNRSRVFQIATQAKAKVLQEIGRRRIGQSLSA